MRSGIASVMTICRGRNDRAMTDWYRCYATRVFEDCVAAGRAAACGNRPATKSMKAFTFAVGCRCCGYTTDTARYDSAFQSCNTGCSRSDAICASTVKSSECTKPAPLIAAVTADCGSLNDSAARGSKVCSTPFLRYCHSRT